MKYVEQDKKYEFGRALLYAGIVVGILALGTSKYNAYKTENELMSVSPKTQQLMCDIPSLATFPWDRKGIEAICEKLPLQKKSEPSLLAQMISRQLQTCK